MVNGLVQNHGIWWLITYGVWIVHSDQEPYILPHMVSFYMVGSAEALLYQNNMILILHMKLVKVSYFFPAV